MSETKQTSAIELVHPDAEGFRERVTPKAIEDGKGPFLFACGCGHSHFRHAGYVQCMIPFLETGGEKRIQIDSCHVMVCVGCRKSYIWTGKQMHDVTDKVDLEAWQKLEKEAHKAVGPGGDC